MVFLFDEGSLFDAPLDVVWKYLADREAHTRAHAASGPSHAEPLGENAVRLRRELTMGGQRVAVVNRITLFPPLGYAVELLEGPLAGSKAFTYYTPKGDRTGVTLVGQYRAPGRSEAETEAMAHATLDAAFAEDSVALREYAKRLRA